LLKQQLKNFYKTVDSNKNICYYNVVANKANENPIKVFRKKLL